MTEREMDGVKKRGRKVREKGVAVRRPSVLYQLSFGDVPHGKDILVGSLFLSRGFAEPSTPWIYAAVPRTWTATAHASTLW